jgi:serine/threonine protein kinase
MDSASKYKLLEQVGNGSFGVVYKAVNKDTGEVVAIKEVIKLFTVLMKRLISRAETTILQKFNRRLRFSVVVIPRILQSIMVAFLKSLVNRREFPQRVQTLDR